MKIIVNSLQVSTAGSKGHLHPAIEIALALSKRGHEVFLLPLPSIVGDQDREQIESCGLQLLSAPILPPDILLDAKQLAELAQNPKTAMLAYQSFLLQPLDFLFDKLIAMFQNIQPDVIVYDMMVYAAAFAARQLDIPDIGYCAGLKLIAPLRLTQSYQNTMNIMLPKLQSFAKQHSLQAHFHGVELLSSSYQMVFAPAKIGAVYKKYFPHNVKLVGSLPLHSNRYHEDKNNLPHLKNHIVLCFGSVYDAADFKLITSIIEKISAELNLQLVIISKKWTSTASHANIFNYMPMPILLHQAKLVIHHGGANTFSEAITAGVAQLIIPISGDQFIQAELVKLLKIGSSITLSEINAENLRLLLQDLCSYNSDSCINLTSYQKLYTEKGAVNAAHLIESLTLPLQTASAI